MIRLALIGKDIAHSRSPEIYRSHLGAELHYQLLDYKNAEDIPELKDLMQDLDGLSITAPYKDHFLNDVALSEDVKDLGAINCIYRDEAGNLWGENTDYLAMLELIHQHVNPSRYDEIIILGDGAMARVTAAALKKLGRSYQQYSRKKHGPLESYDFTKEFKGAIALINCCSRSFYFRGKVAPGALFWDLNYARPEAKSEIESLGHHYLDGAELLERQACHALRMWRLLPAQKK